VPKQGLYKPLKKKKFFRLPLASNLEKQKNGPEPGAEIQILSPRLMFSVTYIQFLVPPSAV
jgi:hypothetical protein